jgi:hypothetical protein
MLCFAAGALLEHVCNQQRHMQQSCGGKLCLCAALRCLDHIKTYTKSTRQVLLREVLILLCCCCCCFSYSAAAVHSLSVHPSARETLLCKA